MPVKVTKLILTRYHPVQVETCVLNPRQVIFVTPSQRSDCHNCHKDESKGSGEGMPAAEKRLALFWHAKSLAAGRIQAAFVLRLSLQILSPSSLDLVLFSIPFIPAPIDPDLRDRLRHRFSTQRALFRNFGKEEHEIGLERNREVKIGRAPRATVEPDHTALSSRTSRRRSSDRHIVSRIP